MPTAWVFWLMVWAAAMGVLVIIEGIVERRRTRRARARRRVEWDVPRSVTAADIAELFKTSRPRREPPR